MTKSSDSELEKRLRSLTETLIKKQTTIEALSSDKSSLTLELERYKRNQVCSDIELCGTRKPLINGKNFLGNEQLGKYEYFAKSPKYGLRL